MRIFDKLFNTENPKKIYVFAILFLIMNTIKLSLFNVFLLSDSATFFDFFYKLFVSFWVSVSLLIVGLKPKRRIYFILIYSLQTIYIAANVIYYLYFNSFLHLFQMLSLVLEGFTIAKNLVIPIGIELGIVFLDLIFFLIIVTNFKKFKVIERKIKVVNIISIVVALVVMLSSEIYIHIANGDETPYHNNNGDIDETFLVSRYGTMVNEIIQVSANARGDLSARLQYGENITKEKTKEDNPNIIYIQVEALDSSIVDYAFEGEEVMPFLKSLSEKSIYYPYTLSYHSAGGTSDSEFATINSLEPFDFFPSLKIANYDFFNSYVSKLQKAKYDTSVFHGNYSKFFSRDEVYPKMGYKHFYDLKSMKVKEAGWGASDEDLFNYTQKILEKKKTPYFAHVITMTSHEPFTNVDHVNALKSFSGISDKDTRKYASAINYVDKQLEDFVNKMQDDNTYIFIIGDHTSAVNSQHYKTSSYVKDNKRFEYVPLFIITPDKAVYKEEKYVASFLDISPTMLNISGIEYQVFSDGYDLLSGEMQDSELPYRGMNYKRSELFSEISERDKQNNG